MNVVKSGEKIEDGQANEIDLIDILRFFFREKKKLLTSGLIGAIFGFVLMIVFPDKTDIKTVVKIDLEKSLNQVSFEALKTALGNAASDPDVVKAGIENALKDNADLKNIFDEKNISIATLAESMATLKPGSRIIEIQAGLLPNSYQFSVNLPKELSHLENSKIIISIINGIVQAYNNDNRIQRAAQDRIRATMAPTAYSIALDNFTNISSKLAKLELNLMELVPEAIIKHVQSAGFAPGANVLEAQFARVRFLMGVAEAKGRLQFEERRKIQEKFLELQDSLGAAQLELDVATEAKRELLKKNLPLIQKDRLPLFTRIQSGTKSPDKVETTFKKRIFATIAGGFLGFLLCFIIIVLTRFIRENWEKIKSPN